MTILQFNCKAEENTEIIKCKWSLTDVFEQNVYAEWREKYKSEAFF